MCRPCAGEDQDEESHHVGKTLEDTAGYHVATASDAVRMIARGVYDAVSYQAGKALDTLVGYRTSVSRLSALELETAPASISLASVPESVPALAAASMLHSKSWWRSR